MIAKIRKSFSSAFDKFLDKFKLDKATFIGYIFFLLTVYILIDRIYEAFYILIVGVSASYWHPVVYALAMLCPALTFAYSCSSTQLVKTPSEKIKLSVMCMGALHLIALTMCFQYINKLAWMILLKFPNFSYIIENMPEVILPAVTAITFCFPIFTIPWFINWYINNIKDDPKYVEGIEDFEGFVKPKEYIEVGPYTCETVLCQDFKSNKPVKTPEKRRYESTLIQGATGTGKTATMIEPMCAGDIEKKFFFREMSKELGYHALKEGLATINAPITNEFLNENFSLTYLTPKEKRIDDYLKLMDKLILHYDKENNKIYYKDIGLTLVAPDAECISRVREVAACYHIPVNYIDPLDPTSLGMNPFILEDPAQVAVIISTVLKGMYEADNGGESNIFFAQVTQQAIENLTILLKVMHPRMHNGEMPTLEDMLKMFYDFNIVEQTCEEMKKDPVLFEEYKVLIGYFERNFYKPPVNINGFEIPGVVGSGRKDTERFIYGAITQLDNLLRHPGVKNVICKRENNIKFDEALERGEIITLCSQKGTLANILSKAFGMFFILAFQYAVLRRPGTENTRVPHFLYIDEFPDYINKETETCFTQFRKYRCGMIIAIQNLSQLERTQSMKFYREVVLTNTKTQVVFGDTNFEDSKYWSDALGIKKKWVYGISWDPSKDHMNSPTNKSGIKKDDKPNFKAHKIQELGFKLCVYKTKDATGKSKIGKGRTDFINKRHKQEHKPKEFNFKPFLKDDDDEVKTYNQTTTTEYFSGSSSSPFEEFDKENVKTVDIIQDNTINTQNDNNEIKINYQKEEPIIFEKNIIDEAKENEPIKEYDDNFNIVFDDNSNVKAKRTTITMDDLLNNSDDVIVFNNDEDNE